MSDYIDKEWITFTLTNYAYNLDPTGALGGAILVAIRTAPTSRFPSEEDYTELRDRFGEYVEFVVKDMISGKGERWNDTGKDRQHFCGKENRR